MADVKIKRALIAVYDKTGIVDFARALVEEFGIEIISTGGTARHLQESGIPVTPVEDVTGFPEMLDGRVKTLHPKIHAAILADRDYPEHMCQLAEQGIEPIDMVVVNLYPFEETIAGPDCRFEDAVEMIDAGGPCLLRAAAKNHRHVLVVDRAHSYAFVEDALRGEHPFASDEELRRRFALSAFSTTRAYDILIRHFFLAQLFEHRTGEGFETFGECSMLALERHSLLRYGENPHQQAARYRTDESSDTLAPHDDALDGPAISFNNYVDANAALGLCAELSRYVDVWHQVWHRRPAGATESSAGAAVCVFVKHTNACGVGVADDPVEAYRRAYLGDPNAAMGGVLACNFNVTTDFATVVMETFSRWGCNLGAGGFFVEVWLAPSFDQDAVKTLRSRKKWGERVRLLDVADIAVPSDPADPDLKKIAGGVLMQTRDLVGLNEDRWEVVTERPPTEAEMADLRLAWLICKHTKSNAVTLCKDGMLIGNGAGQMSRVMSCRVAAWLAEENGHLGRDIRKKGHRDRGAVAASDAFFPFRDGPDLLLDAGVTAIIQPGGSRRDADTIAACNERGAAMVFTHTRHFKH